MVFYKGHAVGHALVGGGSAAGGEVAQQAPIADQAQVQQQVNPCARQMEDFLQCAKNSSGDLNLCYGFNEALRDCKASYG